MGDFVSGLIMVAVLATSLPNTVEAQGVPAPTDKVRVGAVIGVGVTQTAHAYVNVHSDGLPAPLPPDLRPTLFVTIQPGGVPSGSAPCSQTVQANVNLIRGLNVLSLGIDSDKEGENKKLLVNGVVQEPPLGDCFDETNRVVFMVGEITAIEPIFPQSTAAIGLERIGGIMIYDVTDSNGATAASVSGFVVENFEAGIVLN
jgi:hypothetical protein